MYLEADYSRVSGCFTGGRESPGPLNPPPPFRGCPPPLHTALASRVSGRRGVRIGGEGVTYDARHGPTVAGKVDPMPRYLSGQDRLQGKCRALTGGAQRGNVASQNARTS
jgi:hypothetical protein